MADESFGEWLRREREKKSWKQHELSDKSGVSGQQISNIETGRSPNPQNKTRDKLKSALEAEVPVEVVTQTTKDEALPALGSSLQDFDPYDDNDLPTTTGVYVFYDITDRPVYVGRATKRPMNERISEHEEKFWFKRPIVDRGAFVEIKDETLCKQVEEVLIRFLKSNALFNKQHVERG
jgi:transcriptional regulator with XRE-family HTH domain